MKRSLAWLLTLVLVAISTPLWAGPAEEVLQIAGPRMRALEEGNLDAFTAAFADNAVFQSALSPFRIEGKEAIRAYFAQVFQQYPTRRVPPRQPMVRAYNDDLVIQNGYNVASLTDQTGTVRTTAVRTSVVWARIGGRWQIVDQHGSRLPVTQ